MYSAEPATSEDLLRVHSTDYISRFQALSASGGGQMGPEAQFSHGGFEEEVLNQENLINAY